MRSAAKARWTNWTIRVQRWCINYLDFTCMVFIFPVAMAINICLSFANIDESSSF